MSFNDFIGGYKLGELEEVKKAQTVGTDFSELMRKYETVLDTHIPDEANFVLHSPNITEVLTSDEINSFLQVTQKYEDHIDYFWKTGLMFSSLIQNSYNNGYNGFRLNTTLLPGIDFMGSYIVGEEKNPIDVTILGNGALGVGYEANYSMFTINGDAGNGCGLYARFSSFTFNGRVNFISRLEMSHCTFKTTILDNVELLKKNIPQNKGNTLIYIDQGKEVKVDLE